MREKNERLRDSFSGFTNMLRRTTLEAVMLVILGLQSKSVEALENSVAVVGSQVSLECQTHSRTCKQIHWYKHTGSSGVMTIFRDTSGMLNGVDNRYSVSNSSGCDLVIKNVQLKDAGKFACEHIGPDKNTISESAFLIILRSLPKCKVNVSDNSAVEGDPIGLTCEMTFSGNGNVSMTWKDLRNVPEPVKTDSWVKLSPSITAIRPVIPSYECIISFNGLGLSQNMTGLALNVPTAPSCKTAAIKLMYPVINVTLSPASFIYAPGSMIKCSADGNPTPHFRWQISDEVEPGRDGNWTDSSPLDKRNEEFSVNNSTDSFYRCMASNTVGSSMHTAFSRAFQVKHAELLQSITVESTIATSIIATLIVVVIIIVVVIVLLIRRQRKRVLLNCRKNPAENLTSDDCELVQMSPTAGLPISLPTDAHQSSSKTSGTRTDLASEASAYASLGDNRSEQPHVYASIGAENNAKHSKINHKKR